MELGMPPPGEAPEPAVPAPEPAPAAGPRGFTVAGKVMDEAPMVSLQTKGIDSKQDEKGKEYIVYTFGLYIGDERVHTIEERYSQLRDQFKDLPKLLAGGCSASFPGKHVTKDTVNDNDAVRERARDLREFFAALLVRDSANSLPSQRKIPRRHGAPSHLTCLPDAGGQ